MRPTHNLSPVCCSTLLLILIAWNAEAQTITTVAGTGTPGFAGDGGPATSAQLHYTQGVAVDASGTLFIADRNNNRVRKVAAGTGVITTVAGTGASGFAGDGGLATSAQLASPQGVAVDASGNLFIADSENNRIRKVDLARPAITSPPPGAVLSRGSPMPVTLAWTAVPGAAQYGFEHTGAGLQFANPNGTGPDRVNGFGGAGGAFVVPGTSFAITLAPSVPPGPYQVRVIGLSAAGQPVGVFSDALTVMVQ